MALSKLFHHGSASKAPSRLGSLFIFAVLVLAVMLAGSSWLSSQTLQERRIAYDYEMRAREVLSETTRLRLAALSAMNSERGYLITRDDTYLNAVESDGTALRAGLSRLQGLLADDPAYTLTLVRLERRIENHLNTVSTMVTLASEGREAEVMRRVSAGEGRQAMAAIAEVIDRLEQSESDSLAQRTARLETLRDQSERMQRVLGVVGLALLLLGTIAAIMLRRSLLRESSANDELRRIALTDDLTGLANRREVLRSLDRMIASSRRDGRPLSIAILDIDRFKQVNDRYGHPAGDEVIRMVGKLTSSFMREQDLVGRLGGEEFIVAFPDCDAASAMQACERLRSAIAGTTIITEGGDVLNITLSSGVAQFGANSDRTRLIARADAALYDAKEGGRDQVRLAA
ncbi:sensor domain-containing diguanylate cyclase [Aurantiacibacter rhizosphaerae]|uniref:diguanylate cyclase n=1 Tax=Aurantiacibacter rhizosphaerae TaxID=2691582 RepID=A0A844XBI6_9SPHN|nr:diguanylate cyclase [Aurantiacibacter rhizosphaerae]MWV27841.1 diguanylate cyclase [Aurantiacibacter rhizosphaerae]